MSQVQKIIEKYLVDARGATEVATRYTDGYSTRIADGESFWFIQPGDVDTSEAQPVYTFTFHHWSNDDDIAFQECIQMVEDLNGRSLWNDEGGIVICRMTSYPARIASQAETIAGYVFSMTFKTKDTLL